MGTGGGNVPLIMNSPTAYGICSANSNSMKSDNPHSGIYQAKTSRTIDKSGIPPNCNQGGIAIVCPDNKEVYSLTTGYYMQISKGKAPTLLSRDYKDAACVSEPCYGIDRAAFNQGKNALYTPSIETELSPTLVAKGPGALAQPITSHTQSKAENQPLQKTNYMVRRLTPTECARLQGFPDWWCANLGTESPTNDELRFWIDVFETYRKITEPTKKAKSLKQIIRWLKKPHSDSAEYKMWGNGVALPCVYFVLSGIVWSTQNYE